MFHTLRQELCQSDLAERKLSNTVPVVLLHCDKFQATQKFNNVVLEIIIRFLKKTQICYKVMFFCVPFSCAAVCQKYTLGYSKMLRKCSSLQMRVDCHLQESLYNHTTSRVLSLGEYFLMPCYQSLLELYLIWLTLWKVKYAQQLIKLPTCVICGVVPWYHGTLI